MTTFVAALATRRTLGFVLVCIAAACAGGALTSRALDGLAHSPLTVAVARRDGGLIDATLADDPVADRFSTRVLARVHWLQPERARADARRRSCGDRTIAVDASDVDRTVAKIGRAHV